MTDNGWIKLHRKFLEWEWFKTSGMVRLFLFLLLTANHKDKKWKGETVKRGQLITGINSLKKATGLSVQQLKARVQKLVNSGEVTKKATNKYTIITICNYDEYQSEKRQINGEPTNDQQTTNNETTTTNKLEKVKNENNKEYSANFLKFYKKYPLHKNKSKAFERWKKLKRQNTLPDLDLLLKAIEDLKIDRQTRLDNNLFAAEFALPSTWLNGKRWEDEFEPIQNPYDMPAGEIEKDIFL